MILGKMLCLHSGGCVISELFPRKLLRLTVLSSFLTTCWNWILGIWRRKKLDRRKHGRKVQHHIIRSHNFSKHNSAIEKRFPLEQKMWAILVFNTKRWIREELRPHFIGRGTGQSSQLELNICLRFLQTI